MECRWINEPQFRAALRIMDRKARNKRLEGVLKDAAIPMMKDMRARVRKRTGRTMRDIRIRPVRYHGYTVGITLGLSNKKHGRQYIGWFLEYGYALKTPHGVVHVPPRPWFRPAYDAGEGKFAKRVEEGVVRSLGAKEWPLS